MITIKPDGQVVLTVEMCPSELTALQGAIITLIAGYDTSPNNHKCDGTIFWVLSFILEETLMNDLQMTRFANEEAKRKQLAT